MLSIEPVASGGDYHAYLLSEYYLEEQHVGRWSGTGAQALGLTGEVDTATFTRLMDGFGPDGKSLVQNAGVRHGLRAHEPGWDLTFSAPKDVSVLWAIADKTTREQISQCQKIAVAAALAYIESAAGRSRQKIEKGKPAVQTEGKLVIATFGHGVSREKDPQLHTHCVTFNVAVRADGSTGAVVSRPLYQHKMAAGAIYQATLAAELERELGLRIIREQHGFRVGGVPRELSKEFSKRRTQIEKALAEKGIHSAEAAAIASKESRKGKTASHLSGLFDRWRETAESFGFTKGHVSQLLGRGKSRVIDREKHVRQVVNHAAQSLLEHESFFAEKNLMRETANRLRDGSATGPEIRRAVSAWLARPETVVAGVKHGEKQFTTQSVIKQEKALLSDATHLASKRTHAVSDRVLLKALRKYPERGVSRDDASRNSGQRAAVEHLTRPERLSALSGMAGTGKSTVLQTCREVWEKSGYSVTGVALAGKAKKELEKASGIESETLAMRLRQLEGRGFGGTIWHHAKQVVKTAANELNPKLKLPIHRAKSFSLDAKTIVVLDEAGMVGTAQLGKLLNAVCKAGAKIVLVGDAKQLQPINAGGPFARIEKDFGAAKLTHITRQVLDKDDKLPDWRRKAVSLFAGGEAGKALSLFEKRGFVGVEQSKQLAKSRLVFEWVANGGVADPKSNLILSGTNQDVRDLNALCQKERLKSKLMPFSLKIAEVKEEILHEGDRVLFATRNRTYNIEKGDLGTIERISGISKWTTITVQVDDGRTIIFRYPPTTICVLVMR